MLFTNVILFIYFRAKGMRNISKTAAMIQFHGFNKAHFYLEFSEGWALYAENPLVSKYTDTYKDDPLNKYGMLKWQVNKVAGNMRV